MDYAVIGIDIGGTNTVLGIFDSSMMLLEKVNIPTLRGNSEENKGHQKFFDLLANEIEKLAYNTGFLNNIKCIGIGVPGKVNPEKGIAIRAVNLGYHHLSLAKEMKDRLNIPVYIDNDVRNYTRGEAVSGSGKGKSNVICLTLGTGMAAGIMIDGKIVTGFDYYAGEIGHDVVQGGTYTCNCGKVGCLETIASASGIGRLAKEAIQSDKATVLKKVGLPITAHDVYEACLKGDQVALDIFDYVAQTLAYKLLTITYLLNPETIIIGGGVSAAGKFLIDPIQKVFDDNYHSDHIPTISIGSLGDSAGVIGSAYLAMEKEKLKSLTKGIL